MDGELPHDRLAGAGRGGHEHPTALLDDVAGAPLEVVESEVVLAGEGREDRVGGRAPGAGAHAKTVSAPGAHSTVRGSGPNRSPSAYDTIPGAATVTDRARWCSYCGCVTWVPLNSFG